MKRILLYLMLILCPLNICAQSSVQKLQKQQKDLQRQIDNTNKMLKETKSNEKATENKLALLGQNIKNQKKMIQALGSEITALDDEMTALRAQRGELQTELEALREDYARLVRETHYAQLQQSPLVFIFSAESFQQLIRRAMYMQDFARYRRQQAERIMEVQGEIDARNVQLETNRLSKQSALKKRQQEQENLARDERKHQQMLTELKKKEKDLSAQLKKQQKKVADLNKKIDDIIKKEAQKKKTMSKEEQVVAGDFEKNKGKLPWPVENGTVTGEFGKHQHPIYKDVTIDNKGLYIQAPAGTTARAVFGGEVTSVFLMNGSYAIIIQHGNYRSVYSGLSKLNIKQGDKVTIKQKLGTIYTDPDQDNKTELYFQIYKDRDIQNPRTWLSPR